MKRYSPKEIEPKWQEWWKKNGTFVADLSSDKPTYMASGMFNYPSGDGIHVGHAYTFTIPDILARYKRQQGYESLNPVGWDAFGLPAENYAIKMGISPQESMAEIIPNYRKQYTAMGWGVDWTKEINSSEPIYYRWTQWIFAQMYKHGLAYQDSRMQWWCDQCQTVLANEQVIDGKCWRHDKAPDPIIEKKEVKQWFFKITEYADELLEAVDDLNWTQSVKLAQKNWIGRSVGAEITFRVCHPELDSGSSKKVRSYIMGVDDIDEQLKALGIEVFEKTESGHLKVEFSESQLFDYEELITKALKPGFWNEYIGEEIVFIFKDDRGKAHRHTLKSDNESQLLALCNKYAKANFNDIHKMLQANTWYQDWILNQVQDDNSSGKITVFTTRPDTLFGATFMVVAPESDFVQHIVSEEQKEAVAKYVREAAKKTEVERQAAKEKTGVFTGAYATNPVNNEQIPIWVADYVLGGYGTGAIMAVPAHDERDNEFAKKYDLPIVQVVEPLYIQTTEPGKVREDKKFVERQAITAIVKHWSEEKYLGLKWKKVDWDTFLTGGVDKGQTPEEAAAREIQEETGYLHPKLVKQLSNTHAQFFHVPKDENRFAHFSDFYFELEDGEREEISEEENQNHEVVWLTEAELEKFRLPESHQYIWNELINGPQVFTEEGLLVNSGEYNGLKSSEAREKIVADLAKKGVAKEKVNYKMRDWSVSRQRYWGAPIPIVNCETCGAVLVPDEQLPVVLPELTDFKPSGDGRSALARAKDWLSTTCPKCGGAAERETDTLDTYICSSWYLYRYIDSKNEEKIFDSDLVNKWFPIDFYDGADHATAHLLYARFIGRFFNKIGLVENPEPLDQMLYHGKVVGSDGTHFSKSAGNGVDPLEIIESGYGADALRVYLMFAAPAGFDIRWDPQGVPGAHRFISRLWTLVQEYQDAKTQKVTETTYSPDGLLQEVHRAIKKVTEDIEGDRFNTAIAALMALVNSLYKFKNTIPFTDLVWKEALETTVAMLAPFAPHVSEELWRQLGNSQTVHRDTWPKWNEKYLQSETVKIVVQVNGKVRATVEMPADSEEEAVVVKAKEDEKVASYLTNDSVKKTIYIKNKLINFVV